MTTKSIAPRVFARTRPPRVEISRPANLSSAPTEGALDRFNAGIRSADMTSDNIISVYGVIGTDFWTGEGVTADRIAGALRRIGQRDVEVHINSPGGDMFEGVAILNVLRDHGQRITVKVMGLAASAASIIAMAGDEILMGDGANLMIHNCWVMAIGNRHDMVEVASYLEPFDHNMRDIYVAATSQPAAKVEEWMDAETYFSGKRAVELGFADGLLKSNEVVEDKNAKAEAIKVNALRRLETRLTQGGMSRSEARALIKNAKDAKPGAGVDPTGGTPGAAAPATQDAGDSWVHSARDLLAKMSGPT